MEFLTELGTSGLITILVLGFAAIAFVKGAVKLVFMLFTLAGAGLAFYWGQTRGLAYVKKYWASAPDGCETVIAIIAAVVVFWLLRKVLSFLVNPFEQNNFICKFAFGIPAVALSIVMSLGLIWLGINKLRDRGAQDEIAFLLSQNDDAPMHEYSTIAQLKQAFESSALGKRVGNIYELHDSEKYDLAKLAIIANTSHHKTETLMQNYYIGRLMSNVAFRQLIFHDPEFKHAIDTNDAKAVLNNPAFLKMLDDPRIQEDLKNLTPEQLR